jgi:formate-dependent phosphoribosylglycinamide formyltransferase (GAR transformylase)
MSEYETELRAFLGVPIWMTQTVIPVAFAVIALRYAANTFFADAAKDS